MIEHVSGLSWKPPAEDEDQRPVVIIADRHKVSVLIDTAWPGIGRCDSCGRIVVRGMGRWWERRVYA